jgi:hypothetical protein
MWLNEVASAVGETEKGKLTAWSVVLPFVVGKVLSQYQAALTTLPAFRHLAQTLARFGELSCTILTLCRLGSHLRFVLWARKAQEPE